jgi:predicted DNA binding CopG/RHH family protein
VSRSAVIACRLPESEADAFRALAAERGLPVQGLIREAIAPHLALAAVRRRSQR